MSSFQKIASTRDVVRCAQLMQKSFSESTCLKGLTMKCGVYWTLGTRALSQLNTYPIGAFLGRTGTGKSEAERVVANYAHRPHKMCLSGMTGPAIRDEFSSAYEATAVVEEADSAWHDPELNFEKLLNDRYHRESAKASLKESTANQRWQSVSRTYFGATVLHRRLGFSDPSLDGRTVTIPTLPDYTRTYRKFNPDDEWNAEGRKLLQDQIIKLPEIGAPGGIAGRVFDTYEPILRVATLCCDLEFLEGMAERMSQETAEFREAQGLEPDGLVLRGIIGIVFADSARPTFANVRYSAISDYAFREHKSSLLPKQVGSLARGLGFSTGVSHGFSVISPTPQTLLKAVDLLGYEEPVIAEFKGLMSSKPMSG
jgi:hypothetical protein